MLSILYGQTTDDIKMSVKPEPPTKPPGRTVRPFVLYTVELACKWSSESMNLGWRLGEGQSLRSITCPRCSPGHQDRLEVQGILTVKCYMRRRGLAGERIASGLHFTNLLTLNHHSYKCRRIVIYYITSLLQPEQVIFLLVCNVCFRTMVIRCLARG